MSQGTSYQPRYASKIPDAVCKTHFFSNFPPDWSDWRLSREFIFNTTTKDLHMLHNFWNIQYQSKI